MWRAGASGLFVHIPRPMPLCERVPRGGQRGKRRCDARIWHRPLAADGVVMGERPRRQIGMARRIQPCRTDDEPHEMRQTVADEGEDGFGGKRRPALLPERQRHGRVDVGRAVDQRPVKVEDDARHQASRRAASAASRMARILAP